MKVLFGFYYGIGDFISAIPAIREISKKSNYDIYIAVGNQNKHLTKIIDLENVKYVYYPLFSLSDFFNSFLFVIKILKIKFDKIIVSPHCPDKYTSWKIPIILKLSKLINWKQIIFGSVGDRFSCFYDIKIDIDKKIPLLNRENKFLKNIGLIDENQIVDMRNIFKLKFGKKLKKITIHPGASRIIKKWPIKYYLELCEFITKKLPVYKIEFIGLESELFELKEKLNTNPKINFFSGNLENVILNIVDSELIITMDSSFSHISSALGINHIVIFGPTNPEIYQPAFGNSESVFCKSIKCRPCDDNICRFNKVMCMEQIFPEDVFNIIINKIK